MVSDMRGMRGKVLWVRTEMVRDMRGMGGKVLWVSAGCVAGNPGTLCPAASRGRGMRTSKGAEEGLKALPQWLKPDRFAITYGRPEGRPLHS
jgi:hypothetical protein